MPHWVWVVDTTTGHRMDVDKRSLRHGLEPVNDPRYPDRIGPTIHPRRPKHFVGKDGQPATYVHRETSFPDQDEIDAARTAQQPQPSKSTDTAAGVTGSSAIEAPADSDNETAPRGRHGKSTPADRPADTNTEGK